MQPYDNLPPRLPPTVCLVEGLADVYHGRLLAVPHDCLFKITFVRGCKAYNLKSALGEHTHLWPPAVPVSVHIISPVFQTCI